MTTVAVPAVPCVDVHNHLGWWLTPELSGSEDGDWMVPDVAALVDDLDDLDAHHVAVVVNLDGRERAERTDNLERHDRAHPGRFVTFGHLAWRALAGDRPTDDLVARSTPSPARVPDVLRCGRTLVSPTATPWALSCCPTTRACSRSSPGREGFASPSSSTPQTRRVFTPLDRHNERLDELDGQPEWWFGDDRTPTFAGLMAALEGLVASTPATTYFGAHVGGWAENLAWVGRVLSVHSNF